jgi:hypothetical protein
MAFFDDVVRGVGGFFEHLSPIELFNKDQGQKLSAAFGDLVGSPSMANLKRYGNVAGEAAGAAVARYKNEARPFNLKDYFAGHNFDAPMSSFTPGQVATRKNVRVATAAAMGVYGASSLFMGDESLPARASGGALNFAMHAGITKALHKYTNPMAAAAYGGLGVVNMLRSGDNLGPF